MDPRLYTIEPFPSYTDAPPNPHEFSPFSDYSLLTVSTSRSRTSRKPSISTRIANTLRLRYYQYEVTFGLYMMTPGERIVLNMFFICIFILLACSLFFGVRPFMVHTFSRILYYTTGVVRGKQEPCSGVDGIAEGCLRGSMEVRLGNASMQTSSLFAP